MNSDLEISHRTAQKTQRKNTSFDSLVLHRHQRHHRDRQHVVKPCCFVTHPEPKISGLVNLIMGQEVPKHIENVPRGPLFVCSVPQMAENTCEVHFSLSKTPILVKPCVKQHAFMVDPLGVSNDFLRTPTLMFFDTHKRKAQNKKRARNLAPASKFRSLGPPKGTHSDRKGGQKGGHSEFCFTKGAQGERATLYW